MWEMLSLGASQCQEHQRGRLLAFKELGQEQSSGSPPQRRPRTQPASFLSSRGSDSLAFPAPGPRVSGLCASISRASSAGVRPLQWAHSRAPDLSPCRCFTRRDQLPQVNLNLVKRERREETPELSPGGGGAVGGALCLRAGAKSQPVPQLWFSFSSQNAIACVAAKVLALVADMPALLSAYGGKQHILTH